MANIYGQAIYGLTVPDKVALGIQVIGNYTGNTNVGTVTTELADFSAANGELEAKNTTAGQKQQEAIAATAALNNTEASWNAKLEKLISKTEDNTNFDKAAMETTGLQTYDPGKAPPSGTPAQVQNLTASTGDNPGEADLH